MRKLIGIIFFIITFLSLLCAQEADSLIIKKVDSLIQVSRNLTSKNDFEKALEVNAIAENLALEYFGHDSETYGNACSNHGNILFSNNNFLEAENWYLESKSIREKTVGKESSEYLSCLKNLANLYSTIGNYIKAEPLYIEILKIEEIIFGKDNPDYANSLGNLAILYQDMGDLEKPESLFIECKFIVEKALGKDHPDFAKSLNNLANFYNLLGKYDKAEHLLIEAKSIWAKALGKEHPHYAFSLLNLGNLYYRMGIFDKAEPFYLEAKVIREKVLGRVHPDYAWVLNNLAVLYWSTGNYEKAEQFFLESKDIREKVYGQEHPDYANSLGNLANLYYCMGIYEKSEKLYLECKRIREKLLGDKHPYFAECSSNLASLYFDIGNYEKAEPLLYIAKKIWEISYGKEHPHYATSLNNLGNLYFKMGNYEKAEPFLIESKEIWEKVLGKDNYEYGKSLSNLAALNYSNGNYKKSELQFIEAKNIFEKSLGNKHPAYVENLKNLALLYEKQNEFSKAELLFAEILQLDQSRLVLATSFLSEFELAKYSNSFKSSEAYIGSFILNRRRVNRLVQFEKLNRLAFDHVLFNKGFLLEAGIKLNNISLTSPESVEIHHRLKTYVRRLGIEYAKPIIERKGVSELEEKLNKAEKEFARIVKGYSGAIKVLHWENVREKLSSGEASIEFVHFGINFPKQTDSIMYAALILLPKDSTPYFVSLFEENELNQLLSTTSSRRMDYVTDLYIAPSSRGTFPLHGNNKTLYDLIWKPLEPHLLGVHKIYFSPSGLLHRINQNAISVDDQKLLSDKYELIQLGSTRQLVINESKKNSKPLDASIFGGINFEMDTTSLNANNFKIKNEGIASRSENGFFYTDSTLRGNTWTYLKGSEHEVSEINNIVYKAGIKSNLYKGNAATEEAFKKLGNFKSESPQIIHLSTHGYFFSDAKLTRQPADGKMDGEIVFKMSEHPMLRSGLIMAGGNHAWKTGKPVYPDAEDGILTAYEISQLDLKNTELVVLSACETGLGDIQGNEGVYGLQRAFKIAGVKNLIMSLWQVPDQQTSELMTTFYKYWLIKKKSIRESLKLAQNDLRKQGLEPFYWAGFVLVE